MHKALYRKYRPDSFSAVIGQDHIVNVLEESIKQGSILHAYLFSGTRGTGKTSVARIFAKDLKCADEDIYEIDAASNTSVEDIRALNESITTMPINSPYKVFILDEVHMLSKSAFNAFLKTLEEPPNHIIFILATTELEKVPDTILSRCQHFSFHRPSQKILGEVIKKSAKQEGFELAAQSISLIALLGDGSFRDAYGTLQKILLVADNKTVPHELVEKILGAPSHLSVNIYLDALVNSDTKIGIDELEKQSDKMDMKLFCELTINKLRAAILYKNTTDEKHLATFLTEDIDFLKNLSKNEKLTLSVLECLLDSYEQLQTAYIKQLPLEIALIKTQ